MIHSGTRRTQATWVSNQDCRRYILSVDGWLFTSALCIEAPVNFNGDDAADGVAGFGEDYIEAETVDESAVGCKPLLGHWAFATNADVYVDLDVDGEQY